MENENKKFNSDKLLVDRKESEEEKTERFTKLWKVVEDFESKVI